MKAMITITWHSVSNRTGKLQGAKDYRQAAYAFGNKPPHYPMPAIPLLVDPDYYLDGSGITVIWERCGVNDYRGVWSMHHE
jgi:hypothetical protein